MYYSYILKVYIYILSIYTESSINIYFTTFTQVILRKYYKSIASYISS